MTQRKLSPKGYPIPQPKGPRPSGPRGRRKLPPRGGGWVPLPGGRRGKIDLPTALPPFPLPAPFRRALRIVNPIQRYKDAWDIGYGLGRALRAANPELMPYSRPVPARMDVQGASCSYDCPSINMPYSTPTMIRVDQSVGSWACPVPNFARCTPNQVPSGEFPEGDVWNMPPGKRAQVAIGPGSFLSGGVWIRHNWDLVWRFNTPGVGSIRHVPSVPPSYVPASQPEVWPNIDPLALPIYRPVQHPVPLPMPLVRALPDNIPFTRESGNRLPAPSLAPSPSPGPTIVIGAKPSPMPEPYKPAPPPPGTRERKLLSSKKLVSPRAILEGLTEVRDAVGALHGALPKKYQIAGDKDLDGMLRDLYQHYNKIDMAKAIRNLATNWATDKVIGRLDGALNKAGLKLGVGGAALKNPVTSAPRNIGI